MRQRTEPPITGDDTALNQIQFKFCNWKDWNDQKESRPLGFTTWGSFGYYTMCPPGRYIFTMNLKFEGPISGDDSAANGFAIACRDLNNQNAWAQEVANTGPWGYYRGWADYYDDEFLCGGYARSERPIAGDDSAFNGFTMRTCKLREK